MRDEINTEMNLSSDLWVFPPYRHSKWLAKMDWYLNWQMCKGLAHKGFHLPVETARVAAHFEVNLPVTPSISQISPLLVLSQQRVPTKKCLVVNFTDNGKQWLETVGEQATQLSAKSLTVFLPESLDESQAKTIWSKKFRDLEVNFISNREDGDDSKSK